MQEEIKNQLSLITKRIDKLAQESQIKVGFSKKTARLRLLAELVREQVDSQEIFPDVNAETEKPGLLFRQK